MNRLDKLRAAKATALEAIEKARDALVDEEGQFKALSDEDKANLDELEQRVKSLTEQIGKEEDFQKEMTASTVLASAEKGKKGDDDVKSDPAARKSSFAKARGGEATDGVLKVGLVMIGIAAKARGIVDDPLKAIRDAGHATLADELAYEMRSMNASIFTEGGAVVPSFMSQEIIDFLWPKTVFLRLNPNRVPMPNGSYEQPGGASKPTAGYGQELANAPATELTFRGISMVAKELSALIPMSNQWIDFSIQGAQAFVERSLRRVMSTTMDQKFLRGDGQNGAPQGIFNIPGVGTGGVGGTYSDATAPTQAEVDAVTRAMINDLATRDVNLDSAAWIMTERTRGYLEDLKDGNGNYVYAGLQMENPTFKRRPVIDTTNLPENLGGSGDAAPLALVAGDHILMGEAGDMELSVSREAAYRDANNVVQSAFQRKETLLLGVMRHDVTVEHVEAITVTEDIRWGA
ncbi:unnamed protein product [Effrenium voratum]|uniref:Phage capsid-like C-terminal domain-containing protein n=1 Tax=Effrenium voratum TaxID=2562239 RepID=A0AA36IQ93_9DINO|nr:unnamed protein product [Effrenium voratum]